MVAVYLSNADLPTGDVLIHQTVALPPDSFGMRGNPYSEQLLDRRTSMQGQATVLMTYFTRITSIMRMQTFPEKLSWAVHLLHRSCFDGADTFGYEMVSLSLCRGIMDNPPPEPLLNGGLTQGICHRLEENESQARRKFGTSNSFPTCEFPFWAT
jgi:hypothetical protein